MNFEKIDLARLPENAQFGVFEMGTTGERSWQRQYASRVAEAAYDIADAMLKARGKSPKGEA